MNNKLSFKDRFATNKPKSEWKKVGRKKETTKKNDAFTLKFTISNSEDFTNTQHSNEVSGNIDGCVNYLLSYFTFIYHNHYKPILNNKFLPYSNLIYALYLGKSANARILANDTTIRSSLIDKHLLSTFLLIKVPLSSQQIDKLTQNGKKEYEKLLIELNNHTTV